MSLLVPSEQTHLTHPTYRADIDGLRAVAVLAVVVFHAFPNGLTGGFIGVDIFFVISGYLISSIILSSLRNGNFTFGEFYARRLKRIFPALLVVITTCMVFGWFALLPDEYAQLGKHIAAGAGFVSNFFFWREAGYFDNSAETKPLLHLWSLGIEEQYYIIWPLLLYLAWKRHLSFLILVGTITAVSFAANIHLRHTDMVQTFYSPLTRFWELLTGSLLAYLALHKISLRDKALLILGTASNKSDTLLKSPCAWLCNAQSVVGALLIGIALLLISKDLKFPGWWALLPTGGACLIISAGQHAYINRTVLSHRVMVWIGLISYPLYLWHWPLLSFARIIETSTPSIGLRITAIATSIVLAWATYKLIERPIRFSSKSQFKVVVLSILMILIGCMGLNTYRQDGYPLRSNFVKLQKKIGDLTWERSTFHYINCPTQMLTPPRLGYCDLSGNDVPTHALFGDSHADHIFQGIANLDKSHAWLFIGNHSCPPVSGISVVSALVKNCQQLSEKALDHILETPSIQTVALSFFGNYMLDTSFAKDHVLTKRGPSTIEMSSSEFTATTKIELFYLGLEKTVNKLELHSISVIVMIDIPELPFLPRDCLRPQLFGTRHFCELLTETALGRQKELRAILQKLVEAHPKVRVYDPINLLCDKRNCKFQTDKVLLYRDSHHLSFEGANIIADDFLGWMSQN